jgi:hypothetical protein
MGPHLSATSDRSALIPTHTLPYRCRVQADGREFFRQFLAAPLLPVVGGPGRVRRVLVVGSAPQLCRDSFNSTTFSLLSGKSFFVKRKMRWYRPRRDGCDRGTHLHPPSSYFYSACQLVVPDSFNSTTFSLLSGESFFVKRKMNYFSSMERTHATRGAPEFCRPPALSRPLSFLAPLQSMSVPTLGCSGAGNLLSLRKADPLDRKITEWLY